MVLVSTLAELTLFADDEYERWIDAGLLRDACEVLYFFEDVT